jgi:hypothetical protein
MLFASLTLYPLAEPDIFWLVRAGHEILQGQDLQETERWSIQRLVVRG